MWQRRRGEAISPTKTSGFRSLKIEGTASLACSRPWNPRYRLPCPSTTRPPPGYRSPPILPRRYPTRPGANLLPPAPPGRIFPSASEGKILPERDGHHLPSVWQNLTHPAQVEGTPRQTRPRRSGILHLPTKPTTKEDAHQTPTHPPTTQNPAGPRTQSAPTRSERPQRTTPTRPVGCHPRPRQPPRTPARRAAHRMGKKRRLFHRHPYPPQLGTRTHRHRLAPARPHAKPGRSRPTTRPARHPHRLYQQAGLARPLLGPAR